MSEKVEQMSGYEIKAIYNIQLVGKSAITTQVVHVFVVAPNARAALNRFTREYVVDNKKHLVDSIDSLSMSKVHTVLKAEESDKC